VEEGRLQLISDVIRSCLGVDCAVLMGANIASGVAKQQFCEATIGQSSHNVHSTLEALRLCAVYIYY